MEDDTYFLTVVRYIHQNPIKAGLVKKLGQYKWSSFNEYINNTQLIDVDFVLNMFSTDRERAVKLFVEHNNEQKDDVCLDMEEKRRITDKEADEIIKEVCKVVDVSDLQKFDISKRNVYLKQLKEDYGLSIRQLERVTGLNRGVIYKAGKEKEK